MYIQATLDAAGCMFIYIPSAAASVSLVSFKELLTPLWSSQFPWASLIFRNIIRLTFPTLLLGSALFIHFSCYYDLPKHGYLKSLWQMTSDSASFSLVVFREWEEPYIGLSLRGKFLWRLTRIWICQWDYYLGCITIYAVFSVFEVAARSGCRMLCGDCSVSLMLQDWGWGRECRASPLYCSVPQFRNNTTWLHTSVASFNLPIVAAMCKT